MFLLFLQRCQTESTLHREHAMFLSSFVAIQHMKSTCSRVGVSLAGSLKESFSFISVQEADFITRVVFWNLHEPPTKKGNVLEGYVIQVAN